MWEAEILIDGRSEVGVSAPTQKEAVTLVMNYAVQYLEENWVKSFVIKVKRSS